MMKFRIRDINLRTGEKYEEDFLNIVDALTRIQGRGYDVNQKLYELLTFGFLQLEDRMMMLLGAFEHGTEDLICNRLVAGQMGALTYPIVIPKFVAEVINDRSDGTSD